MQKIEHEKILDNLFDGIYYVDAEKKITYWNKAASRITGYHRDEVVGFRCSDNILRHIDKNGIELCVHGCPLGATLTDARVRTADVFLHHRDGHRVPVTIRLAPVHDEEGEIIGAVEIFTETATRDDIIGELEKIKNEVYLDQVTGIGNRDFGQYILDLRHYEFLAHSVPCGVIFFDLDRFKEINGAHGRDMGDRILAMTAGTVSNMLRSMDTLCRWGGEEFLVILPNGDRDAVSEIAERLRIFIEQSFIMSGRIIISVTVSVGATTIRSGESAEDALRRVEALMVRARESGGNRVVTEE